MRRIDLINSVQKIGNAINKSEIPRAVSFSISRDKMELEELLAIFQAYGKFESAFNSVDKKVLSIFELEELGNPKFWSKIVVMGQDDKSTQSHVRMRVRYFTDFLPNLLNLLKQDNINYNQIENDGVVEDTSLLNQSILTIILPEDKNEMSSPERLIKVLESVNLFYTSFSIILNEKNSDLSVAAIDSGSDKSFDFLGAAKLMTAIKELIIGLWDRVVFHREKQLNERLDLIAKSLPIMEKISELEQKETISREQAEILKRNITTATNNFISAGAITPEFENYSVYNPRKLMAAEPMLLTTSTSSSQEHSTSNKQTTKTAFDDLSDEDIAALKELLNKTKAHE